MKRQPWPNNSCIHANIHHEHFNSLASGRPGCHFKTAIFNLVLSIDIFTSSNANPLRWMPWNLTDDKSTLVQVMAWCRQAAGHYLSQCWPSSMSPYGVTGPQCVNIASEKRSACVFFLECIHNFVPPKWSRLHVHSAYLLTVASIVAFSAFVCLDIKHSAMYYLSSCERQSEAMFTNTIMFSNGHPLKFTIQQYFFMSS